MVTITALKPQLLLSRDYLKQLAVMIESQKCAIIGRFPVCENMC
ncbi:hypothetical protein CCP3SC1_610012 [Gammaproteobacteria bacterium]